MDRALDEVIGERQRGGDRGGRSRRRNNWPRDGPGKTIGRDDNNIDTDWLHDKYEDDSEARRPYREPRRPRVPDRRSPDKELRTQTAQLQVDNLHYELTEEDLEDLFTRIGPISSLSLRYDRAGRSTGTAFVAYHSLRHAQRAIEDFDGANANGQPIRLKLLPSGPSAPPRTATVRNPFDYAVKPGRSLFDRVEEPRDSSRRGDDRDRSRSPGAPRRSDTRKPPPEGIDRYVPGGDGSRLSRSRSRSPIRRRERNDSSRRNAGDGRGGRGERGGPRGRSDREGGRHMVNGRPRKTQEQLDKEMEDYWKAKEAASNGVSAPTAAAPEQTTTMDDGDTDMVL